MYTTTLLQALFSTSVLGASLIPRQTTDNYDQVIGNLSAIPGDITTLNNTLNGVDPNASGIGFFTLLAIQGQSDDISNDISAATAASNSSSPFTSAESSNINSTVSGITPLIDSLLDNFVRHKPAFDNQGVTQTVVSGLQEQRELTREEGNSLEQKLAEPYASAAPGVQAQVLALFDQALAAFAA